VVVRWSGVGYGSPFTVSTSDQAGGRWLVVVCGCGWVEHCAACSDSFCRVVGVGLAHCWVLRRHLCFGGFLGAIPGLAGLTRVVVRGGGGGFGVWLCVECCIVDASILLWSSV
jgi:hypothetical protein